MGNVFLNPERTITGPHPISKRSTAPGSLSFEERTPNRMGQLMEERSVVGQNTFVLTACF